MKKHFEDNEQVINTSSEYVPLWWDIFKDCIQTLDGGVPEKIFDAFVKTLINNVNSNNQRKEDEEVTNSDGDKMVAKVVDAIFSDMSKLKNDYDRMVRKLVQVVTLIGQCDTDFLHGDGNLQKHILLLIDGLILSRQERVY